MKKKRNIATEIPKTWAKMKRMMVSDDKMVYHIHSSKMANNEHT